MTLENYVLLCVAALLAGVVNAVAGGGTLLTFPAVALVLGPTAAATVMANATSFAGTESPGLRATWVWSRKCDKSATTDLPNRLDATRYRDASGAARPPGRMRQ